MYFPSKKSILLGLIIWGANASLLWDVIIHPSITGYVVIITFIPFISFLWFKTGYEIIEQHLVIRSGPFKSTIPIADIKKLTPSKTLLAGPALSLDRIEIAYGLYDIAIVSPKDKAGFAEALRRHNETIEIPLSLLPNANTKP